MRTIFSPTTFRLPSFYLPFSSFSWFSPSFLFFFFLFSSFSFFSYFFLFFLLYSSFFFISILFPLLPPPSPPLTDTEKVHGRSREQRYTKLADWGYISQCAAAASPLPVFGCGDILSFQDYEQYTQGQAGIMIARYISGEHNVRFFYNRFLTHYHKKGR